METSLRFLSQHDSLTGLFNRAYFEQKLEQIKRKKLYRLGILLCDVDGLKLINDTLGHQKGDEVLIAVAEAIKKSFSNREVIARIAGDEFAVIIPDNDPTVFENALRRIEDSVIEQNSANPEIPISLSVGYAIHENKPFAKADLFKEADNNMYRKKLYKNKS